MSSPPSTRDHGGNLDQAIARYGGTVAEWIDLSTGINRIPYPLPNIGASHWQALPTRAEQQGLIEAAQIAYETNAPLLPLAGAQAGIQMLPQLLRRQARSKEHLIARLITPTYNEHAASLEAAGWQVEEAAEPEALRGADLAVLVNPNNPDGRHWDPEHLLDVAKETRSMVVDESFVDTCPSFSLSTAAGEVPGLFVLRSFGKFYGLAGLRLGFVLGPGDDIRSLQEMAGPWPVSGPAMQVGQQALLDRSWARAARQRLASDAIRLDALMERAGAGTSMGGTDLFRLYETQEAARLQDHLARAHIWSRIFPWSHTLLRLGLPGEAAEWLRLKTTIFC